MDLKNKKLYLKTLSQNIRQYGFKFAGRVTKEFFASESYTNGSYTNELLKQEQAQILEQQKADEKEYQSLKEKFKAVKNNSLKPDSGVGIHSASNKEKNDQNVNHPYYKELQQKYGHETALDMISAMEKDPDFLNKLKQSEKEDAEYQAQEKNPAVKISQSLQSNVSPAKPANGVNWDKINSLQHNKDYDCNNQVRVSNVKGPNGQELIDQLAHNKDYDRNNTVL